MGEWLVDRPLRVGGRMLRSRVYLPAHQPGLAEGGRVSDRYVAYHRKRARAGLAMQVTGATPILPSAEWNDICLWNVDESCVPGYQRLAEAVHAEGGTMLAQLAHPGPTEYSGPHVVGASLDFSEVARQMAVPATTSQLAHIVELYAAAADRCRRGDLDGVEISMAHGLLLASFLSPLTNHREDEYGGSVENRLRLPLQVLTAARAALGPDRLLGVRLGIDDLVPGGLTPESSIEIARALEPHCDYLSVMVGNNNRLEARVRHWPPTPARHGLFRHAAHVITDAVDIPVAAVGRVLSIAEANDLLAAGDADLVGMVRAHIADPDLLPKSRDGAEVDVRPCVGSNVCVNSLLSGTPLTCMVNPDAASTGAPLPAGVGAGRRVVVIGAGPAGLEAARRLGGAGFFVDVFDTADEVGGRLRTWSAAPSRREFRTWIAWAERQLDELRVRVHLGRPATAEAVTSLAPEHVLLATGASPLPLRVTADDGTILHVDVDTAFTSAQSGRVVVVDRIGGPDALLLGEKLADDGCDVTLVTSRLHAGEGEGITTLFPLLRSLNEAGVRVVERREVAAIANGVLHLTGVFGEPSLTVPADLLVPVVGCGPVTDLFAALAHAGHDVRLIGDALRPRSVTDAIADATSVVDVIAGSRPSPAEEVLL